MPRNNKLLVSAACLAFLFGCGSSQKKTDTPPPAAASTSPQAAASSSPQAASGSKPAPAPARTDGRKVKSKDGKVDGEIFGTPAAKSKFAKLEIGMSRTVVEKLIGGPDDSSSHPTGRQFTPFYFGGDTLHYDAYYKNEGQLIYSNPSRYSAPDTLTVILVDRKATGKRP
jgi:hypothetical protein